MTTLLLPVSSLRSVAPPVILFGVAPHFYLTSSTLRLMKLVIPNTLYEQLDCLMYHSYQSLVTYFFETFSGTQVFFYGDLLDSDKEENVLYISNHQSSIDWSLANFVGIRQNSLGKIRYIMKSILKYIPFFGPYFAQHGCIFVKSRIPNQKDNLRRELKRFVKDRSYGYWLVIFPEGTRMSSSKTELIQQSDEMAKQKDLPPFKNVLFPKTKGIELCLDELKNLDAVYNLTIAFKIPWLPAVSRTVGPSLFEMVSVYGREIHLHFQRIPADQIPKKVVEQQKWVYSIFQEKDRLLSHFYDKETNGSFPGKSYQIPLQMHQTIPYALFYTTLLMVTLATETGRKWYIRSWIFGFASLLCMPITYGLNL